jgi:hypothetical protein
LEEKKNKEEDIKSTSLFSIQKGIVFWGFDEELILLFKFCFWGNDSIEDKS